MDVDVSMLVGRIGDDDLPPLNDERYSVDDDDTDGIDIAPANRRSNNRVAPRTPIEFFCLDFLAIVIVIVIVVVVVKGFAIGCDVM